MIEFVKGSILESDCEAWVNPVNCVGVMGAGLALEFKKMFPDVFERYKNDCSRRLLRLGKVYQYEVDNSLSQPNAPRLVLCATTKDHWRERSHLTVVKMAVDDLLVWAENTSFLYRVALPYLGCGLGGVNYKLVKKVFIDKLSDSKGMFKIYENG